MDVAALQLGSRFVLAPNQLGYCGRGSAPEKFKSCIRLGKCAGVEEEFSKFIVFHPYLRTLADVTHFDKCSYPVVEAYWLGNNQLRKAGKRHYNNLLGYFKEQGVPEWFVEELDKKQPRVFVPFHLFQILHVGVGRASGVVPFNLDSINNCMIRWGRVVEVGSGKLEVRLRMLEECGGRYKLTEGLTEVVFSPELVPGLKAGDTVAVHWGMVAKRLSKAEEKNLKFWTERVLEDLK